MTNRASRVGPGVLRGARVLAAALCLFFCLTVGNAALAQYEFVRKFGTFGSEAGEFRDPGRMMVDSQGQIWITENDRLQICDYFGNCSLFGGNPPPLFAAPHGVAETLDGRIVISTFQTSEIHLCQRDTAACNVIMESGGDVGEVRNPSDVVVDDDGKLIIADRFNDRIQICDTTGGCSAFGSRGQAAGQFWHPSGVALDGKGNIIVSEWENSRISICTYQGDCEFFGEFEPFGDPGNFSGPQDVAVDHEGRIIVTDTNNARVQICDDQGDCSVLFGMGDQDGEFFVPQGVVSDGKGNLIVSDLNLNRIQIFNDPSVAGTDFIINPGLNDAWLNVATAGQGFFIIVFPDTGIVFLAWFTYDTELPPEDIEAFLGAAEHRWLTAQGPYEGDTATLDVFLTEGGVFDMAEPAPATGESIGTITIVWTDCENGVLSYDIDPPGVKGEIPITRIVPDNVALCEALANP